MWWNRSSRRSRRGRSSSSSITSPHRRRSCCPWRPLRPSAARGAFRCWWTARTSPVRGRSTSRRSASTGIPATCTNGRTPPGVAGFCGRRPRGSRPSTFRSCPGAATKASAPSSSTPPPRIPSSYLAAPEGIALLREWDFDACVKYMHGLAWEAAGILTERWGTTFEIPRDMVGTMVTVPLPEDAGSTDADATRLAPCAARRGAHRSPAPRVARPPLDESLGADLQRSIGHRTARRRRGAHHNTFRKATRSARSRSVKTNPRCVS